MSAIHLMCLFMLQKELNEKSGKSHIERQAKARKEKEDQQNW